MKNPTEKNGDDLRKNKGFVNKVKMTAEEVGTSMTL